MESTRDGDKLNVEQLADWLNQLSLPTSGAGDEIGGGVIENSTTSMKKDCINEQKQQIKANHNENESVKNDHNENNKNESRRPQIESDQTGCSQTEAGASVSNKTEYELSFITQYLKVLEKENEMLRNEISQCKQANPDKENEEMLRDETTPTQCEQENPVNEANETTEVNNWVDSSPYAPLPPNAVVGGYDSVGSPIYVGRSFHEGDLLPTKVIPSKRKAFVAWGGAEHPKDRYELLVGENYSWQPCLIANIPPNAISTGKNTRGEPLYVGRGHYANSLTVGKVQPSHGCLYIPYEGAEVRVDNYEILVYGGGGVDAAAAAQVDVSEGHKWIPSSAYSAMPPNAVFGGNDNEGNSTYVGRSFHNGDMLVVQVIPDKQMAFASWRGAEVPKDHFEILCGLHLVWRHCFNHIIPENAVSCGTTSLEQPVYIGRGNYEGSLSVGRISKVHHALFIPFQGVERRLDTYEILVEENLETAWKIEPVTDSMALPPPPPLIPELACPYPSENAYPYPLEIKPAPGLLEIKPPLPTSMPLPHPVDPPPPYTAIAPPMSMHTPKATPAETYIPPSGSGSVYPPPPPHYGYTPALSCETSSDHYDKWVAASPTYTPSNAVYAGHDSDKSTIYVCRAFHNGEFIPGKAIPNRATAYIPYLGGEIRKYTYEVLVDDDYMWVPAVNGYAPGAVMAGRHAGREVLYFGRAYYNGSLTCGKIQRSHGCLYIAYGGREIRIDSKYEILVHRDEYYRGQGTMY